jgi:hypothetical protein
MHYEKKPLFFGVAKQSTLLNDVGYERCQNKRELATV